MSACYGIGSSEPEEYFWFDGEFISKIDNSTAWIRDSYFVIVCTGDKAWFKIKTKLGEAVQSIQKKATDKYYPEYHTYEK